MNRAIVTFAVGLAAAPLAAQAPAPAAPEVAGRPAAAPAAGAKVWVGHYAEFEEFLRTAAVERVTSVPVGVTKPRRVFFAPGGLAESALAKHLPMGQ
ncbi:MAG TPA: hypothetical protein VLF95_10455, partial [Vicinamibacteria bacterium]|nr:hypothetical protein [Vicinamibacteria bacterium]